MSASGRTPAALVVLITCPTRAVGQRLARTLVEEGLAACVNLVPGLLSYYRWQGKLCRDPELLLIAKTRRAKLTRLQRRVRELHPYSLPEIIALPVSAGSRPYLAWIRESTP